MARSEVEQLAHFSVENVGGIDHTSIELSPGVTVLAGKNATNRTSFLQAIQAVLGSDNATLKGNRDEGRVTLTIGGTEYHRTLTRIDGDVAFGGEPYLDDSTIPDLFAFLLESNEARQAVALGEDLREIIMRPVDVDEINDEIARLDAIREEIDEEIDDIDSLKRELPDLEQRRASLRTEIEATREELEELERTIGESSASIEETREEEARLEAQFDDLRETRSDLEAVRYDIDSTEESLSSLKQELNSLRAEREEIPDPPADGQADPTPKFERLREEKQQLEGEIQHIQRAIQFNEQLLAENGNRLFDGLVDDSSSDVTAQLLGDERLVCWTCGSQVDATDVESTQESMKSIREEKLGEIADLETRLEELHSEQERIEEQRRRRRQLDTRIAKLEDDVESREDRLDDLRSKKRTLTDQVEALEAEVEALEAEDFSEILKLHKQANQLEFQLDNQESTLEDVVAEIERAEAEIRAEDDLRDRRASVIDQLEECRTRIDRIESDAVEAFNTHMDAVLDILGYDNLERIWIERLDRSERTGRREGDEMTFELHVVRSTESGAVYEDTVEHLSESEREVTGLVFSLAGYLVHEVHELVPFMLLDSLESIDADRIADLVDYFAAFAEFLVVALLPEDAQGLIDEYDRIAEI